jgi:hypothetical protein
MSAPFSRGEVDTLHLFFNQTFANIEKLRCVQKHDEAQGLEYGLRRLASAIRHAALEDGFSAELLFGEPLRRIDEIETMR